MLSFRSFSLLAILAIVLSGCVVSVPGKEGSSHHVIIGFGVVSVNEAPEKAIIATDTHALGLSLTDRPGLKFGIGYSSSTVVTVAPHAKDVRVEVSKKPWGPLVIDTQSAVVHDKDHQKGDGHENKSQ
jgi:hypothetical protein